MLDRGTIVTALTMMMVASAFSILLISLPEAEVEGAATEDMNTLWEHEVAFSVPGDPFLKACDGIAVGEVYADRPGLETVFVSRNGWVYLSYYDQTSSTWMTDQLWQSPGQLLSPAIGDLRPDKPGNEIIAVGLSYGTEDAPQGGNGTATVLVRETLTSDWTPERAFTQPLLVHGCDIGDVDPTIPGNEAVVTTFNKTAVLIWWDNVTKTYQNSVIFPDSHNVRKVVIADILPERPGNELVAVSKSGNATLAYGNHTNWTWSRVYTGDALARVAVGNIDPDDNLEIYLGSDTNKVIGLKRSGSTWTPQEIMVDSDKNRGVWIADVDPNVPGNELYSFGYSRRLVQITGSFSSGWSYKDLFLDTARGHEIRIGDLRTDIPGLEIAIVGYSGNVTIVSPGGEGAIAAPTITGPASVTVASGGSSEVTLNVEGGNSVMMLSCGSVPGVSVQMDPGTVFLEGRVTVRITASPTKTAISDSLDIVLWHIGGSVPLSIPLSVTPDNSAPTIGSVELPDGTVLTEGAKVASNATFTIEFSEPVTRASFESALSSGDIRLEWGDEPRDAIFTLSGDGKELTVELNNMVALGDAVLYIGGLTDAAGNEVASFTLTLKVQGKEDGGDDYAWLVIMIALSIIIVVIGLALYLLSSKKEPAAEEMEEHPSGKKEGKASEKEEKGASEGGEGGSPEE